MRAKTIRRRAESGVVLLIAIFVLMLVSVIAIALIVSSGTETALASNYRSSATVYYAAMAGLEEARQRMQSKSPDYFNKTIANFMPPAGTPLALTSVRYIVNPLGGENVFPWDPTNPYYDTEYGKEFFPTAITGVPDVVPIQSISGDNVQVIPGPIFKWVRINAVTEASLHMDVDHNSVYDSATVLYYDPKHTDGFGTVRPSLIVTGSPPASALQALEITALAVLPNGSQKILQYVVAGSSLNLSFPSALTFVGSGVQFTPYANNFFNIDGNDQFNAGACTSGAPPVGAVGYTIAADNANIQAAMSAGGYPNNFKGYGGSTPNTLLVSGTGTPPPKLPSDLQTAAGLASLMTAVQSQADLTSLPGSMSAASPKIIFINGDLDTTGWPGPGYGLLAVTGKLKWDGHIIWRGIILVIGQGEIDGSDFGPGEIDGGILVAQTPGLGPAKTDFTKGGNGIYYSHCWIQAVLPPATQKVLSFREVPQ